MLKVDLKVEVERVHDLDPPIIMTRTLIENNLGINLITIVIGILAMVSNLDIWSLLC